jgi:DNA anti-recombination protein RmuC
MEETVGRRKEGKIGAASDMSEYRESIRKGIDQQLQNSLTEEIQKAVRELGEEQRKAIQQIVEEHKAAIRQVVEEEKKSIWDRADLLRQSILKFGL